MYDSRYYKNYADFAKDFPEIANDLLDEVGSGEWQNEELYYYPTVEDFAEYELTDGWYVNFGLGDADFHEAPNPIDYIDLTALGEALLNTGDTAVQWTDWNCVVTTGHGW